MLVKLGETPKIYMEKSQRVKLLIVTNYLYLSSKLSQ